MTQKETLDSLLKEIRHIKTNMPNGEMKIIQADLHDLKEDISDMKYMLMNPEDGIIVKTNKNSDFRRKMEEGEEKFQYHMSDIKELKQWKSATTKALWIIFGALASIIIRMLMMHSDKINL